MANTEIRVEVGEESQDLQKHRNNTPSTTSEEIIDSQPVGTEDEVESSSLKKNIDNSPFEDIYRKGNFGITLGKVHQKRGRKWAYVHLGLMGTALILSIIGIPLLKSYYKGSILANLAIGFTMTNSILGVCSAATSVYFFKYMERLQHPYAILMTTRFFAVFNWALLLLTIIFTSLIVGSDNTKAFVGSEATIGFIKALYAIIVIIMIIELVVSMIFVCNPHWSDICNTMSCCGDCCVYGEGEEIAPGMPNPPSQEKWELVAHILYSFHSRLESRLET